MTEIIFSILSEIKPDCDFRNNSGYIENGLLDSIDIVNLISKLEAEFKIEIDGLDVIPENFESVSKIAETVRKNGVVI